MLVVSYIPSDGGLYKVLQIIAFDDFRIWGRSFGSIASKEEFTSSAKDENLCKQWKSTTWCLCPLQKHILSFNFDMNKAETKLTHCYPQKRLSRRRPKVTQPRHWSRYFVTNKSCRFPGKAKQILLMLCQVRPKGNHAVLPKYINIGKSCKSTIRIFQESTI